jgi:hypothetical protein
LLSLKFVVIAEYDQEGTSLGREGEERETTGLFWKDKKKRKQFFSIRACSGSFPNDERGTTKNLGGWMGDNLTIPIQIR